MKIQPVSTVTSKKSSANSKGPTDKLLPRLTLSFFNRPKLTALFWLSLTVFGILSYTTLLKREGFPSVAIPIVIVNGVYAVNDPAVVDNTLASPISEIALKQDGVKSVSTDSQANFFSATLTYDEKTDAAKAKRSLQQAIQADNRIPKDARLNLGAPIFGVTGGSLEKIDATISVTSANPDTTLKSLVDQSKLATAYLQSNKPELVQKFNVADPYQTIVSPVTGQSATVQRIFDRYGERKDGANVFKQSVTINVAATSGADVIKLDAQLRAALEKLEMKAQFSAIRTDVSASYAPSIKDEISELQRVLLEGLIAVLVIGSLIIAVRASLITVLSMLTVIALTNGVIYLVGYSLNVITLFALILGLALIVDDTIIMVEAIDSARRKLKDRKEIIAEATRKISRAMTAATFTAALSFAPLLFVGGVLGSFIRAIPVTIISALLLSLIVALIFIPLFSRWLLLSPKQMKKVSTSSGAAKFEAKLAHGIVRPMLWARHSRIKEFAIGMAAVCIGLAFIGTGVYVFQKVTFNIFPPSKDTNQIAITLTYPSGTSVEQAESVAVRADALTSDVLGSNFVAASYYGTGNERTASMVADLIPYGSRDATAPELVDTLNERFEKFEGAAVSARPVDAGPPASAFQVDINATNRPQAERLARDMAQYLDGYKLKRISGTEAVITSATVNNLSQYNRTDNKPIVSVIAGFKDTDTTTLTTLAQSAVTDYFTAERLSSYGLQPVDISFNIGQESENQDSFKSLAIAFPLVMVAIYILLIIQFRSLLQPLLIFVALPFSFFGIALGLYLTDNAFSFFSMLGFFALIGLSIKNTILLTDYANQARRSGMSAVDAAAAALGERFRPLVATSLTAVVSLIPLALTSPFWESLAVTLIFGLLSSTFLVITVFPYYYLGAEYLRLKIPRRYFLIWAGVNIAIAASLTLLLGNPIVTVIGLGIVNAILVIVSTLRNVIKSY